MSYWVYQHLGNLSPAELAADPLYAAVRADAGRHGGAARVSPPRPTPTRPRARWSYRRDFGRVRLLMVDTRAARVLDEERARDARRRTRRAWLREQAAGRPGVRTTTS